MTMTGYVVFWVGADGSDVVDWRAVGQALPAGAVPAFCCDGEQTLTLHGHGDTDFGRAIDSVVALAEEELEAWR